MLRTRSKPIQKVITKRSNSHQITKRILIGTRDDRKDATPTYHILEIKTFSILKKSNPLL